MQRDNTIKINDNIIGYLNSSPSDGSFGNITINFDSEILKKGSNTLTVGAVGYSASNIDDFEFTNIIIRFGTAAYDTPYILRHVEGNSCTYKLVTDTGSSTASSSVSPGGTSYSQLKSGDILVIIQNCVITQNDKNIPVYDE